MLITNKPVVIMSKMDAVSSLSVGVTESANEIATIALMTTAMLEMIFVFSISIGWLNSV